MAIREAAVNFKSFEFRLEDLHNKLPAGIDLNSRSASAAEGVMSLIEPIQDLPERASAAPFSIKPGDLDSFPKLELLEQESHDSSESGLSEFALYQEFDAIEWLLPTHKNALIHIVSCYENGVACCVCGKKIKRRSATGTGLFELVRSGVRLHSDCLTTMPLAFQAYMASLH